MDKWFVVYHNLRATPKAEGTLSCGVHIDSYNSRAGAIVAFHQANADSSTNWAKCFMIRGSDGKYLFEMEAQKRT